MHVKGMVQVAGVTYRIVRVERGMYDVVRILDDQRVGQFRTIPRVEVTAALQRDAHGLEISRGDVVLLPGVLPGDGGAVRPALS